MLFGVLESAVTEATRMRKGKDSSNKDGGDSDALASARKLRVVGTANDRVGVAFDDSVGDYNIKILRPLFGYLRNKLGEDVLADIVHDCGLPPEVLRRETGWVSHARFEHFLAAARELIGSDEEFVRACAYELKKQYGAFVLLLRATSVTATYKLMTKTSHLVCSVGSFSTHSRGRNSIHIVYETTKDESRLNCLSRQAQFTALPAMFLGGAPARLHEHSCVAYGDKQCDYELTWNEHFRLRRVASGMLIGGFLASFALPETIAFHSLSIALAATVGGSLGLSWELWRLIIEHMRFAGDTAKEMEKIIVAHARATDDLTALREQERDWNRQIEGRVVERTRKLNEVIERLQVVLRQRSGQFPAANKSSEPDAPTQGAQSGRLTSIDSSVDKVSRLVGELADIASDDATKRETKAEPVSVDATVVQLRRQLKALMSGRDIRVTVFQTREAPATIHTSRPIFERVLDNLLFNASRHTDRGSVVLEAGGTPGSLLIKVSDTGSGLSKERLEAVFSTTKDSALSTDRSSLAYAARLLDQIGGRLDIMSEPGAGTTVWMYLPITMPEVEATSSSPTGTAAVDTRSTQADESMVGRVVRIRSKLHPVAEDSRKP